MRIKDPELRKVFQGESEERLRKLESGLQRLRESPEDAEVRAELFREAHTLKGAARMAGLEDVGHLTHMLEDSLTDLDVGAESPAFTTLDATLVAIRRLTREATASGTSGEAVVVKPFAVTRPGARVIVEARAEDAVRVETSAVDSLIDLTRQALDARTDPVRLAALTERLHEAALDLRALPFSTIAQRLQRAAHDTARSRGKDVYLLVEGAEERIDKRVLDEVKDALMHLLQNCIDHGIEDPATRVAKGKTATGLVCVSAVREGDDIVFEVSDDGRGIDQANVLATAIRCGLVTTQDAGQLVAADIHDMLFQPGFTTKKDVTATSGRGVGLDVVRTKAEKLDGAVSVESAPGQGTVFRMRVPRTF